MRATSRKLCSLYLTGLLVLTAFASGVGTMGVVAASGNTAGNASLTTPQTAANAAADYHVVGNFPTTTGTVDTVRVDFGGSAANFGYTIVERNRVKIDGTPVDVGSTSVAKGGEAFDLELASPQSVDGPVTVSTDLLGVENPPTVGTHDVTVGLRAGDGSVLKQAGGTVTIVEGGTVRGSVLDAASGNVVVDRSTRVTVSDRASGAELTTHGTSPSGTYSMTVPAGTYFVNVTSDGYARGSETVSVTTGTTVDRDVSLDTGGTVSGTVTDGSGDPVAGLDVSVYREPTNTYVKRTQTAADGSYSFALDPDTSSYVVVAGGGTSDYEVAFEGGVTVSDGATTTVDLTAAEKPPSGDIEVTVEAPKGDPVSGATVSYRNSDFSYGGRATTDPSGVATISEPAGVYTLRVEADGYGTEVVRGVTNNASETNAVTVGLESPAYISGTVTGADGKPASRVPLLVSDGSQFYPATTDANGDYTVTVSPGEYSVSVFARGQSAPSQTVDLAAGERATADFSMETASIEYTDVSIVDGPGGDADLGARANLQSGLLQFQLVDESSYGGPADTVGIPDDLTSLGVTDATEFRIKLTVKNFDPNSLIWGLRNAEWETRPNESVTDGTDIIVTGSTVDLQAVDTDSYGVGPLLFKSPSQVDWPTGRDSVADFGFRRTVYFGLFDLSTIPGPAQDNLNGISTTTNAQRFAPPTYENDTLRVWMAAPSKTVGGDDHTGFYQATIPDSLLEEWGVDDPESELQVTYKDRPREFSVTETDTGARINIDNIGYSASYADIQPDESAITADSGSDGGYEYSPPETTTATPTATQTQTTTATATATQTQTQTATATATQTRTATATATETPTETDGGAATPTSTGSGPGFGVAGALAALAAAVLLGRRR